MTFDASQALRYAADQALAVPSIVGVSPYAVYLVTITNDQVQFNDTGSSRAVLTERILVADGFRSYAALDGYLNPLITQMNGEALIISGGQILATNLVMGPLVAPYSYNSFVGGTDPQLFQPLQGSTANTQVFVQIKGTGLSPKGNWFAIKWVELDALRGLTFKVILESTSGVVV